MKSAFISLTYLAKIVDKKNCSMETVLISFQTQTLSYRIENAMKDHDVDIQTKKCIILSLQEDIPKYHNRIFSSSFYFSIFCVKKYKEILELD